MSYHYDETDTGEAIYKDRVRRTLLRPQGGLSTRGCIGILIALALAALIFEIPATPHADGGFHSDTISQDQNFHVR
jgi:hypothetical protein